MDWSEAYYNGLTADLSGLTTPIPPWLNELNWRHSGLYLVIAPDDLLKALPGSVLFQPTGIPPKLEIIPDLASPFELRTKITQLEDDGFPLVALLGELRLKCEGAVITRVMNGSTHLVGSFEMTGRMGKTEKKYKLPTRIEVSMAPGTFYFPAGQSLIEGFETPCVVTGVLTASAMNTENIDSWLRHDTTVPRPSVRGTFSRFTFMKG